jgi:hypothetical protein
MINSPIYTSIKVIDEELYLYQSDGVTVNDKGNIVQQ